MSTPAAGEAPAAPVTPPHKTASGRRRLAVVAVLLAAGVGLLLYKGLLSSLDYFDTVDQALAHRAAIGTASIRLEGVVAPGSVRPTATGEVFSLQGADCREVTVVNRGQPPQLFQPLVPVVVVGRFTSATSDTFASNQIMVKHSATYTAAYPGRLKPPKGSCR